MTGQLVAGGSGWGARAWGLSPGNTSSRRDREPGDGGEEATGGEQPRPPRWASAADTSPVDRPRPGAERSNQDRLSQGGEAGGTERGSPGPTAGSSFSCSTWVSRSVKPTCGPRRQPRRQRGVRHQPPPGAQRARRPGRLRLPDLGGPGGLGRGLRVQGPEPRLRGRPCTEGDRWQRPRLPPNRPGLMGVEGHLSP